MIRALSLSILSIAAILMPTAHVLAMSCSTTSVSGVAFGSYDVFDTSPTDTTGSITYECSSVGPSDTLAIELSAPSGAGSRNLDQGSYQLSYELYLNAARTSVWVDGSGGTSRYEVVEPAESTPVSVPVYGRISAMQNAYVGSYSDTIIATLVF